MKKFALHRGDVDGRQSCRGTCLQSGFQYGIGGYKPLRKVTVYRRPLVLIHADLTYFDMVRVRLYAADGTTRIADRYLIPLAASTGRVTAAL
jgi:hypothetical protein